MIINGYIMMSVFNCLNICYAYQNTFPRLTRVRVTRYISSKFDHDIKVDDYDSDWDMGLLANYTRLRRQSSPPDAQRSRVGRRSLSRCSSLRSNSLRSSSNPVGLLSSTRSDAESAELGICMLSAAWDAARMSASAAMAYRAGVSDPFPPMAATLTASKAATAVAAAAGTSASRASTSTGTKTAANKSGGSAGARARSVELRHTTGLAATAARASDAGPPPCAETSWRMNRLVRWSCADLIHGCTGMYRNSLIREKKLPSVLSQGCRLFFCSAKHPQKESACPRPRVRDGGDRGLEHGAIPDEALPDREQRGH